MQSLVRAARQAPISTISTRHLNQSILRAQSQRLRPWQPLTTRSITPRMRYSVSSRLYSTEQSPSEASKAAEGKTEKSEATTTADKEGKTGKSTPESEASEDPVKKELEAAKKEILDLKDRYLRSVADYRNQQEIMKREINSAKDFAISKFVRDLLDSIDSLERALSVVPEAVVKASEGASNVAVNKDLQDLYNGLKSIEAQLLKTLSKHGVERFDPAVKGDKFDPKVHVSTFMAPVPDKENNTVFKTVQTGFSLNGRIIRPAQVGVVKNP